jgi:hypothetical protein
VIAALVVTFEAGMFTSALVCRYAWRHAMKPAAPKHASDVDARQLSAGAKEPLQTAPWR